MLFSYSYDQLYMAVCFWFLVKCDLSMCKQVKLRKLDKSLVQGTRTTQGHVYLVALYDKQNTKNYPEK